MDLRQKEVNQLSLANVHICNIHGLKLFLWDGSVVVFACTYILLASRNMYMQNHHWAVSRKQLSVYATYVHLIMIAGWHPMSSSIWQPWHISTNQKYMYMQNHHWAVSRKQLQSVYATYVNLIVSVGWPLFMLKSIWQPWYIFISTDHQYLYVHSKPPLSRLN
mgnify:CR=1 FL=1